MSSTVGLALNKILQEPLPCNGCRDYRRCEDHNTACMAFWLYETKGPHHYKTIKAAHTCAIGRLRPQWVDCKYHTGRKWYGRVFSKQED